MKLKEREGDKVVLLDMRGEYPLREGNPKNEKELVDWYDERLIKFTKGDKEK